MNKYLSLLLLAMAGSAAAQTPTVFVSEADEPMKTGKFAPTWESLSQYEVPEWFQDAKFGIWAHWGPQCVEGSGDWMARGLYEEGSGAYKHHCKNYGHPSEVGFKDILPLFKAEKWNPDSLVEYYKKVGARYFFALGNHHDNFDLWDSKYQPWNSKEIGPKRDILAEWERAARKQGLPFGVSIHADHAWSWYEPSRRYDRKGPKASVPYDGNLTIEDGKGKWWEGLDPQMLYAQNHPVSKSFWCEEMPEGWWEWGGGVSTPSQEFVTNVYNRTLDVINRYKPDIMYFDVTCVPFYPFSDAGLKIAAHYYNSNMANNKNGKLTAVMTGKILSDSQKEALVWDVERGAPNYIVDKPWQTCSCIGGWHYNQDIYDKDKYKSGATVVKLLADIVSKNGNLLLSVPLRGDGTFDEKEYAILEDIRKWLDVNGEAIYSTRPWKKFGEGPIADSDIALKEQGFNEGSYVGAGADEIRFTQTPKALYAIALGMPANGVIKVKSLAKGAHKVKGVQLLGHGKIPYLQTPEGLVVSLPTGFTSAAPVLKIDK